MGIMPVCRVGVKIKCITYKINTCSTKGQTIPIIQAGNNHIHRDRMVVITAGRKEEWEVMFYEYRVSVHDSENVLETEAGDGCRAVCVYLVPPNYI